MTTLTPTTNNDNIATSFIFHPKMVAHLIAIGLPLTVFIIAISNFSYFSWHPICMSAAYGLLMVEGIMVFSKQSSLVQSKPRSTKINYHGYILFTALCLALTGFTIIYTNKNFYEKQHFTTPHGIAGVCVVCYTAIQVPAGVLVKYASMLKLPKSLTLSDLKFYHGMSGCTLFILSCLAMLGGIWSNWFTKVAHDYVQYGCTLAIVTLILVVGMHAYQLYSSKRAIKK